MAVKVTIPNSNYSEQYAGVQFRKGTAVFEDEKKGKRIAKMLGYEVEEIKEEKAEEKPKETKKKAPKKTKTASKTDKSEE